MPRRGAPLGVGVVGCGRVAVTHHLPVLQRLPEARLVAVADVDPGRLERVAGQFEVERRYPDFQALLEDRAVDVVAVCVPALSHADVALTALDAGKHVLVEKPLALRLDDCDRLIERAKRSRGRVAVGFNMRCHRLVRQARATIRRGALGPIKLLSSTFTGGMRYREDAPSWRARRDLGGGVLLEQAIHHFDLWRFLLQDEVAEIFAASRLEDESAALAARMVNGALAASACSEGTSDSNEIAVYGHDGRLQVSCYRFDGFELFSPSSRSGDARARLRGAVQFLRGFPRAAQTARQGGEWQASYRAEWQSFVDAIERDGPVHCTLEDGRRAVQVALAAVESASTRQPVRVDRASREITPTR